MENVEIEILLVEDNPSDAELTLRALRNYNMANKVIHVTDGAQALDFIFGQGEYINRKIENTPKLILLDLKMPKVSGTEVLRVLKTDERTKLIPIVILTSSKEDPDIQECYRLGVNSYVVKPVHFNDFMKVVTDLGLYWLLINQSPK